MQEFKARRAKLSEHMRNDSICIIPSARLLYRNSDVEFPFRQNSTMYYLTGFNEPNSLMVLLKDGKGHVTYVLFNRPHDPKSEIWNGKRVGQEGAVVKYLADEAHDIHEADSLIPEFLQNKQIIYYPTAHDKESDHKVLRWLHTARNISGRNFITPDNIIDISPFINEMRLFKSPQEIEYMRRAAQISAQAHNKLLQVCRSGMLEYQLEAVFNEYCLQNGCRSNAYSCIVAGGANACTLHYINNDQILQDGDLVLIDAGGEYNNYAADITRTFPVNGKFTPAQQEIYSIVLAAQLAGIEQVKPGNTIDKVQEVILQIIVEGLLDLGILAGDKREIIANRDYEKFYMHSSGHWLGLDVHDVGLYKTNGKWRKFEPDMVLTVEPGIYIAKDTPNVDPKWLGIGVRIEDDVLVTKRGNEVLSAEAVKQITEIESARV